MGFGEGSSRNRLLNRPSRLRYGNSFTENDCRRLAEHFQDSCVCSRHLIQKTGGKIGFVRKLKSRLAQTEAQGIVAAVDFYLIPFDRMNGGYSHDQ